MDLSEFEEYNEKKELENTLFIKIWTSPKEAFKFIVKYNYDKYIYLLLILAGISRGFDRASSRNLGDTMSLDRIIILSVILGGLFGWIGFYIYAAFINWTGGYLKGKGNTKSILAILAYSSIPSIVAMVLLIPEIIIYGVEIFKRDGDTLSGGIADNIIFYLSIFLEAGLGIWTLVLLVIGLAEVQKFSIGKAILNLLLPLLFIAIPLVLFVLIAQIL